MLGEMRQKTYTEGKVVKVAGDYNYRRYNKKLDTFESLAYAGDGWSWTTDARYYAKVNVENSTFGQKIFELLTVCWFDPWVEAKRVVSGCHYNVYLLHGLKTIGGRRDSLSKCSTLFVEVLSSYEGAPSYKKLY